MSKGIPNAVRSEAWKRLLDIDKNRKAGVYQVAYQSVENCV